MKYIGNNLGRQLLVLLVVIFDIVLITVGFIIPKSLTPIYETIIYTTLKNPLEIVDNDIHNTNIKDEIVYIYYYENNVYYSKNYDKNIKIDKNELSNYLKEEYGNFEEKGVTYYYYASQDGEGRKVAIVNEDYIVRQKADNRRKAWKKSLILSALRIY